MKRLFNKCCSIFVAAAVALSVVAAPSDIGAIRAYAQENADTAVTLTVTGEVQPGLGSVYDVGPSISFFGLNNTEFSGSYKNQLDTQSQGVYDKLYAFYASGTSADAVSLGITGTLEGMIVEGNNLSAASQAILYEWADGIIIPAFLALIYDHPELSWISNVLYSYSPLMSITGTTGTVRDIEFVLEDVVSDTGDIDDINTAVATAKSAINTMISNSTVRYNIVKGIHDYLCENIEYNDAAAEEPQTKYTDAQLRCYQTAYSAFYPCNGDSEILTVCAGYARGFKVLCDSYGIPCVYVTGDAGTSSQGAHAWNYVQMDDGKWYAIDATWDDQGENAGVNNTYYEYFLSGSDTVGFDSTTFTQSHVSSGNWTTNEHNTMLFVYPEIEASAYVYSTKTDIATTTVTVSEHAYNESEQSPTIIVKNGDTTLVQDTDYTVTGTTSATDGGTYAVTLTGIGNYSGTKTVEWTIERVTPEFVYTKSTPTYNGTAQQLLTVNKISAGCVAEYSFDRTNWSTDIPTRTDAGTYRVYYHIIGTNNYSDDSGNNFQVTIAKATPTISVNATPSATSIGKAITVTATVFNHDNPSLTDTPTPELSYKIGSNDAVAFTGSFTIPAGTATGTNITITASTAESDNYFPATSPTTVSVIDCPHDGENTLEWDTDSHWYACEFCGATLNSTVHSGGTATCTDKAVCSTCNQEYGDVDATNHAGKATEWTSEYGYHWHECACGEDLDKGACAGGTATCTSKAVCSTCNQEYGNVDANNHIDTVPEWSKDSTNHWYTCDCGKVISAAHTSGGAATDDTAEICTVCGYIITPALSHTTHTADTSKWYSDETNHWHRCTGCEEKMDITSHSGGTATCTSKAVCSACTQEYGNIDSSNHANMETQWTMDENCHWHGCDCGKPDYAEHISGGAATPDNAEICTICNYEISPATGYVAAPAFTPASGTTFESALDVTIACATEGAKIYYTTDGTEPTTASTMYEGAITVSESTTIKAIAVKDGMGDSNVVTAEYRMKTDGGSSEGTSDPSGSSDSARGPSTPAAPVDPTIGGKSASWSTIADDISKLPIGSEIVIELNGNTDIPVDVIKQIAENDTKAIFVVNGTLSWLIDGAEINGDAVIDLGIIPIASLKTHTLRGEAGAKFRVDGTNAPTKLIVALDKKYVGKFANLYKKEGDKLVFVDNVKVDAQGKVIFPVSEQGDYAIMLCEYSDRKGDATNDGITNKSDVTAILKDIVAIMSAVNPDMMDYNGDSRANALDASAILIDIAYGVI